MSRRTGIFVLLAALFIISGYVKLRDLSLTKLDTVSEPRSPRIEAAPMCPWREPERDRMEFFPTSTGYEMETRILSHQRVELAARLGRPLLADENALHLFRVFADTNLVGTILTRRVKGEYGLIEIVVAVDTDGAIRGMRFQRSREPESIMRTLNSSAWLGSFKGKRVHDGWELGVGVPVVPPEARPSAKEVAAAVHSLLVLLEAAEKSSVTPNKPHHR